MTAVLGDMRGDWRQLRHLMATRVARLVAGVQATRTVRAAFWNEIDPRVHAINRHQLTMVTGMSWLPTRMASAFHPAPALTLVTRETIGRRRLGRNRGILLLQRELPLQVVDLACLIRDLLRTLLKLASQVLVLALQPLQLLRALIRRASMTSSPLSLHPAERTKSLQKVQAQSRARCQRA